MNKKVIILVVMALLVSIPIMSYATTKSTTKPMTSSEMSTKIKELETKLESETKARKVAENKLRQRELELKSKTPDSTISNNEIKRMTDNLTVIATSQKKILNNCKSECEIAIAILKDLNAIGVLSNTELLIKTKELEESIGEIDQKLERFVKYKDYILPDVEYVGAAYFIIEYQKINLEIRSILQMVNISPDSKEQRFQGINIKLSGYQKFRIFDTYGYRIIGR